MIKDFQTEIKTLLIVVLVAVVISVGGILLLKGMQPAPISAPDEQSTIDNQQSTIDTSDWQTYRNEEFGFEFQIPKNYQISDIAKYPNTVSFGETFEHNMFITVSEEPMVLGFRGTWGPIFQSETNQKTTSSEKVQINGAFFTKNYWSAGPTTLTAYTNYNGKVYTLSFAAKPGDKEEARIFNQILATFRFTE